MCADLVGSSNTGEDCKNKSEDDNGYSCNDEHDIADDNENEYITIIP